MAMIPIVGTVGPDGTVTGPLAEAMADGDRYTAAIGSIADLIIKESAAVGRTNMLIDNLDKQADALCDAASALRESATNQPLAVGIGLHSAAAAIVAAAIKLYGLAATMRGDRCYFDPADR